MQIHRDINNLPKFNQAVVTIGSFDGVHRGHQKIIKRLSQLADEIEGESVLVTFHPHPRLVIYPKDQSLELLSTIEEKATLCEKYGVDHLVVVPFSIEFSQQSARAYVEQFLLAKFNPRYLVIGYDHRFGLNRSGDVDLLRSYEKDHGFEVVQIKKQELEDITISSTKIRNALSSGDVMTANQFLKYEYSITGKVVHGDKIGSTIGFPTANLGKVDTHKLIPADGVYAVKVHVDDIERKGMLYIGNRPTLSGEQNRKIEVHIFDFNDNIYNQNITVSFVSQLRGDQKFDDLEGLRNQLRRDEGEAIKALEKFALWPMKASKVHVVILNYNGEEFLESYLPSVLYSHSESIDVTVIDNHSSDESVAFLQEWYPEINVIQLGKNYGFAEGYNRGLKQLEGQYFVILNSDVQVTKFWLDPIIDWMDRHPETGACQPKIKSLEHKSEFEYAGAAGGFLDMIGYPYCRGRIFDHIEIDENQYDRPTKLHWASGAAMVVRSNLFHKLGGFDGDYFAHMEEIDFCRRLTAAGYSIYAIPESIVYHLGGGTLSYDNPRKIFLNFRNSLITMLKNDKGSRLLWTFPLRLVLDGVAGIRFLIMNNFKAIVAIIQAHWHVFLSFGSILKKRKITKELVHKHRYSGPIVKQPDKIISLVWSYFIGQKKTFQTLHKKD